MKQTLLFFAFALALCLEAQAQVNNIVLNAGVAYTNGAPTFRPGGKGSRIAIDTVTWIWYESLDNNTGNWIESGYRVQPISGCSHPAYTPNKHQSVLVINGCDSLYYYRAGAWRHINPPGVSGVAWGDITGDITSQTDLQTALSDKADAAHNHALSDVLQSGATSGQVPKWNGTAWVAQDDNTGTTYTAGTGIAISGGNVISNTGDLSNTNEIQTLSIAGQDLSLSNGGGTVTLPSGVSGSATTGQVAYWNGTSSIAGNSNVFYDVANNRLGVGTSSPTALMHVNGQLKLGAFTTGGGALTEPLITTGILRAAGGLNLRSPVVGDNTFTGLALVGNYPTIYKDNTAIVQFQGSGSNILPSLYFSRYCNPPTSTTSFGVIQGDITVDPQAGYTGTVSWLRDISNSGNGNSGATKTYTSIALNPLLYATGVQRGVHFAPLVAVSTTIIAYENTVGNNYMNTTSGVTAVGTSSPNASAKLEVSSTTGGILFPRMTTTQRDAIATPADGLVIYNTTTAKFQGRAGGAWVDLH